MNSPALLKKYLCFATIICACLMLRPFISRAADSGPQTFPVLFDENDPYEMVLTAERYRRELMREDIERSEWRKNYFEKAQKLYQTALLIDPHFHYGYLSYAYTCLLAGESLGEKKPYRKKAASLLASMERENPWAHLLHGQLYCFQENWDKAKDAFDKALGLGSETSTLYAWAGYAMAALDKDGMAQKYYKSALDNNTDPLTPLWAREQMGRTSKPWDFPPIVPPPPPRKALQPASVKMRLQVVPFNDTTRAIDNAAIIFSHLLATQLYETGRFNMVDKKIDRDRISDVDALLTGNIIRVEKQTSQFTLDIKATHPATGDIILAATTPITFETADNVVQIPDKEVKKVADMIGRKLPRGEGQIVHISGRHLIVNLGSEHGLQSGVTAVIIGKGEKVIKNPLTGNILSRDIYLGEIVFDRIDEKISIARLLTEGRINMKIGDTVRLK